LEIKKIGEGRGNSKKSENVNLESPHVISGAINPYV
jgi:hypothetical protein